MLAIISDDGRKPLSIADRVAAPAEERAQAYSAFMAYAGRYTFTCDKVVTQVEVASLQNWVNTDQTRFVSLHGNRMFVRNTPQLRGGVMVTIESVWERLKQQTCRTANDEQAVHKVLASFDEACRFTVQWKP